MTCDIVEQEIDRIATLAATSSKTGRVNILGKAYAAEAAAMALSSDFAKAADADTYTDEDGTLWVQPSAYRYAMVCKLLDKLEAASRGAGDAEGRIAALEKALEPFAKAVVPDETTLSGYRFGIPAKFPDYVRAQSLIKAEGR